MQQFLSRGKIGGQMRKLRSQFDTGPKGIASSATATYVFTRDADKPANSMFGSSPNSSQVNRIRSTNERKVLDPETAAAYEKVYSWIKEGEDGALVTEELQ